MGHTGVLLTFTPTRDIVWVSGTEFLTSICGSRDLQSSLNSSAQTLEGADLPGTGPSARSRMPGTVKRTPDRPVALAAGLSQPLGSRCFAPPESVMNFSYPPSILESTQERIQLRNKAESRIAVPRAVRESAGLDAAGKASRGRTRRPSGVRQMTR